MVCGDTLDEYTCTRELTREGRHIGQHYDEINETQWRDGPGTWLVSLGPCNPRTTMLTETPPH
jgi:hypothetical protein